MGIDIETTGLDFEKDQLLEVAWVVKDVLDPRHLFLQAAYVSPEIGEEVVISDEVFDIHKITERHIVNGIDQETVTAGLYSTVVYYKPDFIVAHNGFAFDKPFLEKKLGSEWQKEVPWFDTKLDVKYPKTCYQTNLLYLAAYHGFLNPFPHSALFDVLTMLQVLDTRLAVENSFSMFEPALTPFVKVQALVGYDKRQLAKERGYQWDGDQKIWAKTVREFNLEKERAESSFPLEILR